MTLPRLTPADLRAQTLGVGATIETPYGTRPLVYADYTASGRQLAFVEDYLRGLAPLYANSHTEDSTTGRTATRLLHDAEATIKARVNAGPDGRVVCCGTGSTGAIHKLQEILGIAVPPATLRDLGVRLAQELGEARAGRLVRDLRARGPVVFVGPYEHHSNEVTWREGLCTVVEIGLDADGQVCLDDLDRHLADPQWQGRRKIGSFSAASNVTGVLAPVAEIARRLHAAGALALFDYAAGGPYVEIDMCPRDPAERLDAVFLSPHKCIGGPGASGVLVFHDSLYPHDLAPSVGGGGTVQYVSEVFHDYTDDVEARETAGTPGMYQVLRAALALDVKAAVGVGAIRQREHELLKRALARWAETDRVEVLGPTAVERLSIVSFNVALGDDAEGGVRDGRGRYLHPRFVTVLLDDLFGIQSRAGCSCAGPYGHRLLDIDNATSARYRQCLVDGIHGLKPGWARVGLHFTMSDAEADYVIDAVAFVAEHGAAFLSDYAFDVATGAWTHRRPAAPPAAYALARAVAARPPAHVAPDDAALASRMADAFAHARALVHDRAAPDASGRLADDLADLQFFALPA